LKDNQGGSDFFDEAALFIFCGSADEVPTQLPAFHRGLILLRANFAQPVHFCARRFTPNTLNISASPFVLWLSVSKDQKLSQRVETNSLSLVLV
jgi:hypothetical protein